ncbi:MAG: exodeoxyribonuclease V subunit gamma [Thiolinea sp.]
MLQIFHSNRLEILASQFAEVLGSKGLDPFKPEQVIVQNAGMGRWLSLQLAAHNGIAANMKYLFPAEITWELLRAVLADVPERDPCSPKLLRWRLFAELSSKAEKYQHDLGHYLSADNEDMAWQLAKQVATVFDGYLFFRPDWIQEWEKSAPTDWQERLWQNVVTDQQLDHWIRLQHRFIRQLENTDTNKLPPRISFFSVPALSPAYIEMISKVAEKTDVYFYVMNPSWQYWGDIESRKQKIKREPVAQEYVTVGNPLLASWGTQGRDFIENLRSLDPYPDETESFTDTAPQSMLQQVQADILNLEGEENAEDTAITNLSADQSVSIHSCHSPMREIEVLYDQLLAALEQDTTLTPADIVVMSPEVDTYAPFIEAVFNAAKIPLPYSIADQRYSTAKNISTACIQLLSLAQGKFEAESVFALLEYAEIRTASGLDEAQVQQCRDWIRAVNVRWGVDKTFREQYAKQSTFEHTWLYGLDRLLLGYMLPGEQLFGDILPYNELEGSQAQVLERFQQFVHALLPLAKWSSLQLAAEDWCERVRALLNKLFGEDAETYRVFQALDTLLQSLQQAAFTRPLPWTVFRDALQSQLEQNNQADGFLGSGITFCTLMPMRSVPFKFVALLGMQDGGFPRQDTRLSFDKLAFSKRRRGDRSRRDEDRYLFLESLLSARRQLYISYVGQNVLTNNTIMPSVLVSELLDYLEKRFAINPETFITRHPLQAFSPRYFNGSASDRLFSYRNEFATLHNHLNPQQSIPPFLNGQVLPEANENFRRISLDELISFYRRPARYFLSQRFDIALYEQNDVLAEREPFALEAFSDGEISRQALQHLEQEYPISTTEAVLRAQGLLPHGTPGQLIFEQQYQQVQQLREQLPVTNTAEQFEFYLPTGQLELYGTLKNISDQGRHLLLFGYHGVWQWLEIWLQHLALNSCSAIPENHLRQTCIYTADQNYRLPPLIDAEQQLTELLEGYWQGLQAPLPFFPKSAWVMYEKGNNNPKLEAAINEWQGTDWHTGEGSKIEYCLLYRDQSPFADPHQQQAFMDRAAKVLGSLFAVRETW